VCIHPAPEGRVLLLPADRSAGGRTERRLLLLPADRSVDAHVERLHDMRFGGNFGNEILCRWVLSGRQTFG